MRALILGENGFLGSYFRTLSKGIGATLTSNVKSLDRKIDTHSDFQRFFSELSSIDVVINCLARANIDFCEKNPEEAHWVNATLPGLISEYCAEKSISMEPQRQHHRGDMFRSWNVALKCHELEARRRS